MQFRGSHQLPASRYGKKNGRRTLCRNHAGNRQVGRSGYIYRPYARRHCRSNRQTAGRQRGTRLLQEAEPGGIHGHIYYENCTAVYLVERPFMGKDTVSLNFINRSGGAMFKIYVGRDENGELRQNQIEAMRALFAEGKRA